MAAMKIVALAALLAAACPASAAGASAGADSALTVNPIRRVVTMLQLMQKKVTAEGKKEEELFDKFMCWCSTGGADLAKSISEAETKIPQLESSIKESASEKSTLEGDIGSAKTDKAEAKEAVATANALREKEAAAFAKASSDDKTNLGALTKAIAALEKGMAGGFLQTTAATVLRRLSVTVDISEADRDLLSAFLSTGSNANYAPQSGEIVGILKQMKDTMAADLAEIEAAENDAKANFEAMVEAKTKQINALTKEIENKLTRLGEVGVELVNLKEDLDDTSNSLAEDKKFLADMDGVCAEKKKEWAERSKTRADELVALADTIKLLNDDDALELFKKTLPTPELLQVKVGATKVRAQALQVLGQQKDYRVQLIETALRSGKISFEKVIKMIDDMVSLLGAEQITDDEKKAYCEAGIDKAEDEAKELDHKIADLEKAIADDKETVARLAEEIEALVDGIKALDKSVAEATEQRKEDHDDFVETIASDTAAKDIIGIAKNRMNKFYNPKQYVAPAKRELSAEDRIAVNMGGTMAPTNAPGGIGGTGVTAFVGVAPPPPPETYGAYQKKGEMSSGVIAMMDMLVADLDKEMQTMQVEEKEAQAEYEEFVAASAEKRAADSKSIAEKEAAKAGLESDITAQETEHKATMNEAMAKAEFLKDLHVECDWLVSNFEVRKAARAGEVDALKNAKAVLSGADYSLLQTARRHFLAKH